MPPSVTAAVRRPTPVAPPAAADRARADLARRLSVPIETVQVVNVSREEVPIDNLRCDNRGKQIPTVSLPAFVNGTEITLRVGDKQYTYYVRGNELIMCP
jgi:hypothetical protein